MSEDRIADGTARPGPRGGRGRGWFMLWLVVTGLWTAATCSRINRVWVPMMGWPTILTNAFTWISLLLPPLIFCAILFGVDRVARRARRRDQAK